jgi:hypothetical protein
VLCVRTATFGVIPHSQAAGRTGCGGRRGHALALAEGPRAGGLLGDRPGHGEGCPRCAPPGPPGPHPPRYDPSRHERLAGRPSRQAHPPAMGSGPYEPRYFTLGTLHMGSFFACCEENPPHLPSPHHRGERDRARGAEIFRVRGDQEWSCTFWDEAWFSGSASPDSRGDSSLGPGGLTRPVL